ncbi:3574_t:CDS:2, partial [Entrophospora sp. SA101]
MVFCLRLSQVKKGQFGIKSVKYQKLGVQNQQTIRQNKCKNSSPTVIARTLSSPPKEIDEDEDDEIEFEDSVIKFGSNYNE